MTAPAPDLEQLRARIAALDCSLGLVLITIKDFGGLSRAQALARIAYVVGVLEPIRRELGVEAGT